MTDLNLLRYYQRLTPLGVGKPLLTTLTDVAESMYTSPRHARNLMHQMQELHWLDWQPKPGRNQRSTLLLHQEPQSLMEALATERIRAGKYEKALSILNHDQSAFGRLLQRTSGATYREGRMHIQLTYKRAFEALLPHESHRSSERYLIRQVYCCLVGSNRKGELEPQLAHHWHYDEEKYQWCFYLRPGLTFHDGESIDANSIVTLFEHLATLTNYQAELGHLERVYSPVPGQIVFDLKEPDLGFGGLLSGIKFSIQPPNQAIHGVGKNVVGSGCFEVVEHSDRRLRLQAFERYYATRALTDVVTIWHLDESGDAHQGIKASQQASVESKECNYYLTQHCSDHKASDVKQTRVEDGCLFMLFNHFSKSSLSDAQRKYLADLVDSKTVLEEIQALEKQWGHEVSGHLLPFWTYVKRPEGEQVKLPKTLSIAIYDYSTLFNIAQAVKSILSKIGIEVIVNTYSYRELTEQTRLNSLEEDMLITNINLDDNFHSSAFSSLFHSPIIQAV
ncbi:SgrR family transcriptional regulator [Vibrio sonorensis]|uniref:SgrR family transcriptional regulator n=1 Tax=Vibrio sonorensis TaxID=1004316 RepID=UPI000AD0E03E